MQAAATDYCSGVCNDSDVRASSSRKQENVILSVIRHYNNFLWFRTCLWSSFVGNFRRRETNSEHAQRAEGGASQDVHQRGRVHEHTCTE